MKNKKLKYKVILESSVIYGKPIRKEVVELIKNYSNKKNLNIKFFAPELVLEESKRHLFEDFLEAKMKHDSATEELSVLLKNKLKKIKRSKNNLFNIVTKSYLENNINILRTPFKVIDWGNLLSRAVFKDLPFNPGKDQEKGFKDSVIAETIIKYLPKLSKNSNVVILVKDDLLTDYFRTKTRRYKNLKIFSSVPDFESALRLHLLENDDKLIEEISKQADNAFYNPLDKTSLFYREGLPKKIMEDFPTLFANPKIDYNRYYSSMVWHGIETKEINWIPVSAPEYRVSKSVFIEKNLNIYRWESTVKYRQLFENEAYKEFNVYYGGYDNKGEHALEFKIKWEVAIDSGGIINPSTAIITKIEYIPTQIMNPMFVIKTSMLGNVTLAGQGTVPVVNPSASESLSSSFSPSPSASPSPSGEDTDLDF